MDNSTYSEILKMAEAQGANEEQIRQLKAELRFGMESFTKKRLTRDQRVSRRNMQKASRRVNRGSQQSKRF